MTTGVFLVVILAACLHASWNAVVKGGADKTLAMVAVMVGHAPFAAVALFFAPAPDVASWPYIALSVVLHLGYQVFLLWSYRAGDLTQVYPLARGSAPLIVAFVSVMFLGVVLSFAESLGVFIIALGIISIGFARRGDGLRNIAATRLALVTGCFIAAYSLIDGLGARQAGTGVGFYSWSTIIGGLLTLAFMAFYDRSILKRLPREGLKTLILGGGASFAAYALVVWAFTQAPIAAVTALRETSIVFALLIGVFVLGEKLNLAKVLATFATICGALLLRFGRYL